MQILLYILIYFGTGFMFVYLPNSLIFIIKYVKKDNFFLKRTKYLIYVAFWGILLISIAVAYQPSKNYVTTLGVSGSAIATMIIATIVIFSNYPKSENLKFDLYFVKKDNLEELREFAHEHIDVPILLLPGTSYSTIKSVHYEEITNEVASDTNEMLKENGFFIDFSSKLALKILQKNIFIVIFSFICFISFLIIVS